MTRSILLSSAVCCAVVLLCLVPIEAMGEGAATGDPTVCSVPSASGAVAATGVSLPPPQEQYPWAGCECTNWVTRCYPMYNCLGDFCWLDLDCVEECERWICPV